MREEEGHRTVEDGERSSQTVEGGQGEEEEHRTMEGEKMSCRTMEGELNNWSDLPDLVERSERCDGGKNGRKIEHRGGKTRKDWKE
ncbi:hypothetical protein LR48_Vigan10g213500 [Vigna angularis]|uniref:Uncharacterized protein n=1 Tax=Phaseolus angularis TaxID=3914 RepID=A0A0L9VMQ6_PHAAN|nr:hypothetical protein LR48_Vigan10g213500 [Vigna angularis]